MQRSRNWVQHLILGLIGSSLLLGCWPFDSGGKGKSKPSPPPPPPVVLPPAPMTISASNDDEDGVILEWATSTGADGYEISKALDPASSFSILTTTKSNYYFDSSVDPAKEYYYKVCGYVDTVAAGRKYGSFSQIVSGYRKGWRFGQVSIYTTSNGIGLRFNDLYVFGYQYQAKDIAIYAVYKNNNSYYYIPGSGAFGKVSKTSYLYPTYKKTNFKGAMQLESMLWSTNWKNNTYRQFIKIRIYRDRLGNTGLSNSYLAQTNYYSIKWTSNDSLEKVPVAIEELTPEESRLIDSLLKDD